MDQQGHDYAAAVNAIAYGQQQQPATNMQSQQQQQQFGYHPQQYPPSHFMPPHPSMPQMPYPHPMQQRPQLHPHPPPHMHHLPPQQTPPPFPPHLPPHHLVPPPFQGTYDSAPAPPAPPPSDPDLQKRIDKLVEYVKKNGPEFEIMVREKEQANPAYSFLFGGEGHNYYHYKLFVSSHPASGPFNPPFQPSSMPTMHPSPHPMMNPAASGPMLGASQMHQPPFPPFYDPHLHRHPPPFGSHGPSDFDQPSKAFKGPLPPDIAMELNNMLNSLNGTKESIKGAKAWFMQRSVFAPALAEALRDRALALDDSERQLYIIYLANDILFDSIQRRASPHDLDNEALAFRPVLGSVLSRIYHNPQNKDEVQSRLQKILQFWASKEVYDQDTINSLEGEMLSGPPASSFPGPSKESFVAPADPSVVAGFPQQIANSNVSQWQPDRQGLQGQEHPDKQVLPVMQPNQQFLPNSVPPGTVLGSMPISSTVQPPYQQPAPQAPQANVGERLPPYPLFPPGLIPGMVRKMQIGSGVPYSPLSPLDIPTIIPPSTVSHQEILERVSKFFKEIGEVNPSEGPMGSHSDDDEYMKGGESPVRKGGACIPPPNLQVDPDTGAYADGSVDIKGSGRLGLGATADPNEPSQYDDVYTSYRKQRSTTYHSSMSAKAVTR